MIGLIAETVVKRPLCPTLIHDDTTRMVVMAVGLLVCIYAIYRVMRYFDGV